MMKCLGIRAIQLAILATLATIAAPRPAAASELGCYVLCAYDDWACILQTGHPADPCAYDEEQDICNLGGCQLGPIKAQ